MLGTGHKSRAGWLLLAALAAVLCLAAPAQVQPVNPDDSRAEVARLVSQAMDETDPVKKLDLSKKAIALDPNNQAALKLRDEATTEIKSKDEEQQRRKKEASEKEKEKQNRKSEQDTTTRDARQALLTRNFPMAQMALSNARRLGLTGPVIDNLERFVRGYQRLAMLRQYLWIGSATVLMGGLIGLVIWLKRSKRTPYLESGEGRRYPITQAVTSIGAVREYSGTPNDIVLADKLGAISRRHCQIHLKGRKLYLVDCDSSNGTFLNGQRLPPQRYVPLRNGARIELAHGARLQVGFERKRR